MLLQAYTNAVELLEEHSGWFRAFITVFTILYCFRMFQLVIVALNSGSGVVGIDDLQLHYCNFYYEDPVRPEVDVPTSSCTTDQFQCADSSCISLDKVGLFQFSGCRLCTGSDNSIVLIYKNLNTIE